MSEQDEYQYIEDKTVLRIVMVYYPSIFKLRPTRSIKPTKLMRILRRDPELNDDNPLPINKQTLKRLKEAIVNPDKTL